MIHGTQHVQSDSSSFVYTWVFPRIGVPQNGWFIMENLSKMDDLGTPIFGNTHIYIYTVYIVDWHRFLQTIYQSYSITYKISSPQILPCHRCRSPNDRFFASRRTPLQVALLLSDLRCCNSCTFAWPGQFLQHKLFMWVGWWACFPRWKICILGPIH